MTEFPRKSNHRMKGGKNANVNKERPKFIEKDITNLMLLVSQSRTLKRYGDTHYCDKHKMIVDKNHFANCD